MDLVGDDRHDGNLCRGVGDELGLDRAGGVLIVLGVRACKKKQQVVEWKHVLAGSTGWKGVFRRRRLEHGRHCAVT